MNTQMEQAISTLTYRVSQLERRAEAAEAMAKQTQATLHALNHELAVGRGGIADINQKMSDAVMKAFLDEKDIAVPNDLRITKAKRTPGKKRFAGGGNRETHIVKRRWALWRAQIKMGYTPQQIARAWGCNRTTINNAMKVGA